MENYKLKSALVIANIVLNLLLKNNSKINKFKFINKFLFIYKNYSINEIEKFLNSFCLKFNIKDLNIDDIIDKIYDRNSGITVRFVDEDQNNNLKLLSK